MPSKTDGQLEGSEANKLDDVAQEIKPEQLRSKIDHTYLFEEAMVSSMDSKLWTNMQFWEDLFLDTIAQQRELLGKLLILRYSLIYILMLLFKLSV